MGGDETLRHLHHIIVVEGETAIALTVGIGNDEIRTAFESEGHGGFLHVEGEGTALTEVVDGSHLELLGPEDTTVEGIGL